MKDRFSRRRELLRSRGLCVRCGREKVPAGQHTCILCAAEKTLKKHVSPNSLKRAEKIARLERNLALCREAEKAIAGQLDMLKAG